MAANMYEMGDYQTMPTLETFGFLPKLTQDEVYEQINYIIAQGWTPAIEHEHPSRAMSYYWTMWKLPFFGEQKLGRVVEELEACRRAIPIITFGLSVTTITPKVRVWHLSSSRVAEA